MTVIELISALENMPFNAKVFMDCDPIEEVSLDKEFIEGDAANPKNTPVVAVRLS